MKPQLYRRNAFWLVLSLILVAVSGVGASLVQTDAGSVEIKDLRWETPTGKAMSALLYIPESATADNPAPGVVASHGWFNNREMQDLNYVELARRGFVVMSIDMYGHGDSDWLVPGEEAVAGTGMYDAVKLMHDLPYVDAEEIGVTGHSNGARAANFSVLEDNEADEPLIAAVLLVDNDPIYQNPETGQWANIYGARDTGLIQAKYDEFFFRTYDENGVVLTAPRDYVSTDNAQSFLHFGADPSSFTDEREAGVYYDEAIDGTDSSRVIYSLDQTHPWSHTSATAAGDLVEFFDTVFESPNPIDAANQVWQWKVFFNTLGLIGFGIFLVAFARALVTTKMFAAARLPAPDAQPLAGRAAKLWFWGGLAVSAVVSAVTYVWLSQQAFSGLVPAFIPQTPPYFIGFWAAVNGVFTLLVLLAAWWFTMRGSNSGLAARGLWQGWRPFGAGVAVALLTVVAAFGLVFVVDYFFQTDFRLWVLAVRAFTPDKIGLALIVLPLFVIYFVANSVAVNVFNRVTIGGREWINTALLAFFNALGPLVLVIAQYVTFAASGHLIPGFGGIFSIWLFPVLVILPVAAIVSRKIYRETSNPYIGGLIMAAAVAMVSASNTLTYVV